MRRIQCTTMDTLIGSISKRKCNFAPPGNDVKRTKLSTNSIVEDVTSTPYTKKGISSLHQEENITNRFLCPNIQTTSEILKTENNIKNENIDSEDEEVVCVGEIFPIEDLEVLQRNIGICSRNFQKQCRYAIANHKFDNLVTEYCMPLFTQINEAVKCSTTEAIRTKCRNLVNDAMSIISSIDCSEKVLEDEKWLKVMALGVTLSFKIMENKQDLRARNRHLSSDQFSSYFMTYNFNYLGQLHMKLLYACHDDKIAILAILIRVPPSYFALQSQMLAKLIRACLNDIDDTYSHSVKKYLILMLAYKKLNNLLQHDSKHLATWKTSFNEKFADQRIPALIVQFLKAQYPLIKKSFAQSLLHVPTSIEVIYNNFQKFERQNMYIPSVVYPPFDKNCKDGVIKRLNESTADATFSDKNSRATSKISNKKRRKNLNTESDDNVVMIIKNLQNFPTSYLLSGNLVTKNHERLYYEDQLKINKISTKSLSVNENIFETNKAEKSGTSQKLHLFNTEKMINTDQVNVVSNILPKISSQELLTIGNQTNLKNLSKTNLKEKENIDSGIIKSKNEVSSELKNSDEIQISMENDIEKGVKETIEKSKTNKELISSEEKIDSEIKENKNLGNFEKSKKIQITEDKQVVESSEKGNDKEREKKFMSHECNDILKNVTTETVNIDQQVLSDDLNEEKIEGNDKEVGKEIMSHETNKILENASTENVKIKINQQVLLDDLNEEKIKGNGKERQKEIMSHERNDILKNVSTENVNIDQHVLSENLNEKSVKENNKEVKKEFTPLGTKEILENVSTENVKIKINQQVLSNNLNEEKIERNDKEVEKQIMSLETNDILKNVSTKNVNIKIDQEVLSGVSNEEKVEENNKVKNEFTPLETNEILGNVSTENVKIKIDQQVLSDDLNEEKIEGNDKEVGKEIMSHESNKILENASTENVKIKINQQVLLDDLNEEKIKGNGKERQKEIMSHERNDILKNVSTENVNIDQHVLSENLNEKSVKENNKEVKKEFTPLETKEILENVSTENVKIKINQQVLSNDLNEGKIERNDKEVEKQIMSLETNDILKNVSTENVNIKIDQEVLSGVSNEEKVEENNKVKKEFTPLETNEILGNVSTENVKIKIDQQVLSDDLNEEKIEGNDKEVGKEIMSHETNEILKNASTENVKIKIDQQVLSGVSNEETVEENNKEVKKEFTPLENESNDILNNEKRSNKNIKIKKIVSSSNTTSPKNTNASTMKESHIKDKNDQFKKIPSHNLLLKTINVKIIGSNTITSSRNVKKALKRGSIALNDYSPTNKLSKNNDNEPLILSSHKNTETLKPSNNFLLSKRPLQNIDEKGTTLLSSPVPLSLNNNKKSKISSRNNFEASKSSEKTVLPNENDPNLKTSSQNTDSIIKTLPIEEIVLNDALRNKLLFETLEEDTNDNNENFIKYLEEQISKTVQFKNDIKSQIEESHRNFNNKYSNDFLSTKKNRKFTQSDLKTYSRSKTQRNTEKQPQLLNDDNKDTSDNDNHESKLLESSFELNPDPLSFDLKLSDGPPTDAILDDLPLNSNNCRPKSILSHPEIIGNTDSFENDVGSSDDGSVMDIFSLLSENIEIDLNEGEIPKNNDLDVQKEFETNETINNLPYINSYSIEGQHFHSFTIDNQKVSEHHKRLQKFDPCFAQPISDTIVQNTAPQHL